MQAFDLSRLCHNYLSHHSRYRPQADIRFCAGEYKRRDLCMEHLIREFGAWLKQGFASLAQKNKTTRLMGAALTS
jgi:hypothetical protein